MANYVVNQRVGVVHTADCPSLARIRPENLSGWDPAKAHLTPGVTACPACLPKVPAIPIAAATDLERLEAVVEVLKRYAHRYGSGRSKLYYQVWHAINTGPHPDVPPMDVDLEVPAVEPDLSACDMCGHRPHDAAPCEAQAGYDHLNGFHECGCPGSLASQLAQAWEEGAEATLEWVANNPGSTGIPHDPPSNPYEVTDA